jgi:hypothetical protein
MKAFPYLCQYLAAFLLNWDKSFRENQTTYFIFNNFFPKIMPVCDNIGKYGGARGHICQYSTAYALSVLDN